MVFFSVCNVLGGGGDGSKQGFKEVAVEGGVGVGDDNTTADEEEEEDDDILVVVSSLLLLVVDEEIEGSSEVALNSVVEVVVVRMGRTSLVGEARGVRSREAGSSESCVSCSMSSQS